MVRKIVIVLFGIFCCMQLLADGVTVQLDRNQAQVGETLSLIFNIEGSIGKPDLTALSKDFQVLGSGSNKSYSYINGKMTSKNQLIVSITPKHQGVLIIPKISFGKYATKPLTVQVTAVQSSVQSTTPGATSKSIFVEASVDQPNPYVQSEVVYTVKLYSRAPLLNGSMSQPSGHNLQFKLLDNGTQYSANIKGLDYQVSERKFSVIPSKAGKVIVHGPVFVAIVQSANIQANNPFSPSMMNPFAVQGRQVQVAAKDLSLTVKPMPAGYNIGNWLPAKALDLDDIWADASNTSKLDNIHVGDPITRTITIRTSGAAAQALPIINITNLPGMNVYPDQADTKSMESGQGLINLWTRKFAMVAIQSGDVTLPAITVKWWNVTRDQAETATIPAKTLHILPAVGGAKSVSPPMQNTAVPTKPQALKAAPAPKANDLWHSSLWPWLAFALLLLWLVSMFVWFKFRRKTSQKETIGSEVKQSKINKQLKVLLADIKIGCINSDAKTTKSLLLQFSELYWPHKPIQNLPAFANEFKYFTQKNAFATELSELDAVLYAEKKNDWNGVKLWQYMKAAVDSDNQHNDDAGSPIPPLYPEDDAKH